MQPAAPPVSASVLSEQSALKEALKFSPQIAAAEAALQQVRARRNVAEAALRPWLSLNLFASAGGEGAIMSSPDGTAPSTLMQLNRGAFANQNLTLMWPLAAGGARRAALRRAAAQQSMYGRNLAALRRMTELQLLQAFEAVPEKQAMLQAAKQELAEIEAHLQNDRINVKQGAAALLTLNQDETAWSKIKIEEANAERDVQTARLSLAALLGKNSADLPAVLQPSLLPPAPAGSVQKLLAEAVHARPEMSAASQETAAAEADVSGSRASLQPNISLFAMGDAVQNAPGTSGVLVGITASLPLANGGARHARIRESMAALQQSRSDFRAVQVQVELQVQTALLQWQTALANLPVAHQGLAQARMAWQRANQRYLAGRSINLEALGALTELAQARARMAQAVYQKRVALFRLRYALGESLLPANTPTPLHETKGSTLAPANDHVN